MLSEKFAVLLHKNEAAKNYFLVSLICLPVDFT